MGGTVYTWYNSGGGPASRGTHRRSGGVSRSRGSSMLAQAVRVLMAFLVTAASQAPAFDPCAHCTHATKLDAQGLWSGCGSVGDSLNDGTSLSCFQDGVSCMAATGSGQTSCLTTAPGITLGAGSAQCENWGIYASNPDLCNADSSTCGNSWTYCYPRSAPPPPPPRQCKFWCRWHLKPWNDKCRWVNCNGCPTCGPTCAAWCPLAEAVPWSQKCNWEACDACNACNAN